jgi:transcriptional regulator with GAF, ATPase, and Fis domain
VARLLSATPLHGDAVDPDAAPWSAVAVIAAGPEGAEESGALALVRAWHAGGRGVLCYGDGAAGWSVASRCRVLLAGASALLDSASPSFQEEARRWMDRLAGEENERRREQERVSEVMAQAGVVGESEAMRAVMRWVLRVARLSDLPVLVTGETGTGKELVALHQLDPKRARGPFIPVNCAAISPALAESELFGHRRGAFTGATSERRGLVRAAQGGVLFLDEIGEMEPALQAKLLRVIQEGRVLGVGADEEVGVDVRVIAATNRDLDALVRQERFRADLLHRIDTFSIRIPPLRERRADLLPLVRHFLGRQAPGAGPATPGRDFMEALGEAALPGNVRELENMVRRACAEHPEGGPLGLADLPESLWRQLSEPPARGITAEGEASQEGLVGSLIERATQDGWTLARATDELERRLVEAALRSTHGNQSEAARRLGITVRSVYNKLRKHHLRARSAG